MGASRPRAWPDHSVSGHRRTVYVYIDTDQSQALFLSDHSSKYRLNLTTQHNIFLQWKLVEWRLKYCVAVSREQIWTDFLQSNPTSVCSLSKRNWRWRGQTQQSPVCVSFHAAQSSERKLNSKSTSLAIRIRKECCLHISSRNVDMQNHSHYNTGRLATINSETTGRSLSQIRTQ